MKSLGQLKKKDYQINMLNNLHENKSQMPKPLQQIQNAAINQENIFEVLMEACKHCSLGQITNALFEVGRIEEICNE